MSLFVAIIGCDVRVGTLAKSLACFNFASDLFFKISIDIGEETWCFHIDR